MTITITPRSVFDFILAILIIIALVFLILVLKMVYENLKVANRIILKAETTVNELSDTVTDTLGILNDTKESVLLYLGVVGEIIKVFLNAWKKKNE
jgi:uncharacterized protein YoxC